jgi:hypothetical protein
MDDDLDGLLGEVDVLGMHHRQQLLRVGDIVCKWWTQ